MTTEALSQHIRPSYGDLTTAGACYGHKRSKLYEYVSAGLLDTFTLGRKRYVYYDSLETLPVRAIAYEAAKMAERAKSAMNEAA